jgi:hypothetical protein
MRIVTAIVVTVTALSVLAGNSSGFYAAYGEVDHQRFMARVSLADIHKTPRWSPDSEKTPPLPPGRAQSIAHRQLEQVVPSGQKWQVDAVRIVDADEHGDWLYEIAFHRDYPPNANVTGNDRMEILVLMDGTPVAPHKIP